MSGFTVSGLSDYVKESYDDILQAAILGADTIKNGGITVQAGIKHSEKLLLLAQTAPFQSDSGCGFTASGSTTFSNVMLTVSDLKWQDKWCPKDIEAKFIGQSLAPGSNYDSLPFEATIMKGVTDHIAAQLEQTIWQGDTTDVFDNNLKKFDGLLKKVDAGSPISATATAAVTKSNVVDIMDDVYNNIPAQLLNNPEKKMVAFTGWDNMRKLILALRDENNFHFDAGNANATGELLMPGTGLKVKAVNGLNNIAGGSTSYDDRIICTYPANLFYGTDLANEQEDARVWYSPDDEDIKASIKWKSGTAVAYTTEVVEYSNT
jgi:hypothetical protein